jgi:cell division protein FtsA
MIEVPSVNDRPGRKISTKALADVVSARYEELFTLVKHELNRSGFKDLIAAGIVLTGGASNVDGVLELAEMIFEMPVHSGKPQHVENMPDLIKDPSYATGVGLLLYGLQQQYDGHAYANHTNTGFKSVLGKMRDWFHGNF